jgi:hypothetical protein
VQSKEGRGTRGRGGTRRFSSPLSSSLLVRYSYLRRAGCTQRWSPGALSFDRMNRIYRMRCGECGWNELPRGAVILSILFILSEGRGRRADGRGRDECRARRDEGRGEEEGRGTREVKGRGGFFPSELVTPCWLLVPPPARLRAEDRCLSLTG